jgi:hypothetical protein
VIAGLYLRGLALEYRAGWESTFLDAAMVHSIVAFAYAPGCVGTGIPVPDASAVTAIRSPADENAARWVHLMAATVALVVIVPRLVLAFIAGIAERHRARHVALPLNEPYFQRLLRGYRGGAARVRVIPYSYTPPRRSDRRTRGRRCANVRGQRGDDRYRARLPTAPRCARRRSQNGRGNDAHRIVQRSGNAGARSAR